MSLYKKRYYVIGLLLIIGICILSTTSSAQFFGNYYNPAGSPYQNTIMNYALSGNPLWGFNNPYMSYLGNYNFSPQMSMYLGLNPYSYSMYQLPQQGLIPQQGLNIPSHSTMLEIVSVYNYLVYALQFYENAQNTPYLYQQDLEADYIGALMYSYAHNIGVSPEEAILYFIRENYL